MFQGLCIKLFGSTKQKQREPHAGIVSTGLPPPPIPSFTRIPYLPFYDSRMSPDQKNYSSINASRKPAPNVHRSHSHSKRAWTRPNRLETLRLAVFGLVLATSLIALALAAHFLTVLQANDLSVFNFINIVNSVDQFLYSTFHPVCTLHFRRKFYRHGRSVRLIHLFQHHF